MSKPTIDDVAALAGVGRASVSRVLNHQPNVREELRERVMRAVAMLGYRVNLQARHLAGRRARRIGLVHASDFDTEPNSYFDSALELGATRCSASEGVQLITHFINQNDPGAAAEIISRMRDDQCDGAILTPPFADSVELVRALTAIDCRTVCIAAGPETQALAASVGIDDRQAGFDIGTHLLALGHRNFGFVKGLQGHVSAGGRFDGFMDALAGAGLAETQVLQERGNFTFRSGIECAQRLFMATTPITALVCANDDMAAGALLAAHKAGLRIPEDIAITGFDDTPVSEIVWPPLTTIHQPLRRIGERAVQLVCELIDDGDTQPRREIVAHDLVVRDSSRLPA
ncbi:MAG: LacI family DNA-binding transcriptional regulator [Sphingomonas sp.]|uniref:LacI family DNA-binding transcriptional regulator n=1 Tax=Sphingomonas sp. TaxID=28214 RepID=UPI00356543FD